MTYKEYVAKHEGLSLNLYHDQYGHQTIGYGRNIDTNGISKEEALFMLDNDLKVSICDLKEIFPNWDKISDNRKNVLIDMRFQLGGGGFRNFKIFIQSVKEENWPEAIKSIINSLYYKQVPSRAQENIVLLGEG